MSSQAEVDEQRAPPTRRDNNDQWTTDHGNILKCLSDLELGPTSWIRALGWAMSICQSHDMNQVFTIPWWYLIYAGRMIVQRSGSSRESDHSDLHWRGLIHDRSGFQQWYTRINSWTSISEDGAQNSMTIGLKSSVPARRKRNPRLPSITRGARWTAICWVAMNQSLHTYTKSGPCLKFDPPQPDAQNFVQLISQNQIMNCRSFSLSHYWVPMQILVVREPFLLTWWLCLIQSNGRRMSVSYFSPEAPHKSRTFREQNWIELRE
jgi:hypothetical protein